MCARVWVVENDVSFTVKATEWYFDTSETNAPDTLIYPDGEDKTAPDLSCMCRGWFVA